MNLIKHICAWILFTGMINHVHAQNTMDIKVKKQSPITREFVYKGKPVSPMFFTDLFKATFPNKPDSTLDLRKYPFPKGIRHESNLYSCGFTYNSDYTVAFSLDSFDVGPNGETVAYEVIGLTAGNKFIVHAYFKEGLTTHYFQCIFILDIQGDKLIELGTFIVQEEYDTNGLSIPIEIKGNIISHGDSSYKIPASAL